MKILVIAEPGSTHEGDYDAMVRLAQAAAAAGCDVLKSQWTSSADRMAERRHAPEYLDSYLKLQYPLAWHQSLRDVCRELGMEYGCTVYIPGDAALVSPFVDYLKVSSFEAGSQEFLDEATDTGNRVIVSTGMMTDYTAVLSLMGASRFRNRPELPKMPWAVLHCCSSYPAPLRALNLSAMTAGLSPSKLGFSDHSRDMRVGGWAVCAGAEVIETHFRLDDCSPANRDYGVAFTPWELGVYVRNIRDAELAYGDGIKRVQDCEQPMLQYRSR